MSTPINPYYSYNPENQTLSFQAQSLTLTVVAKENLNIFTRLRNYFNQKICHERHWVKLRLDQNDLPKSIYVNVHDLAQKLAISKQSANQYFNLELSTDYIVKFMADHFNVEYDANKELIELALLKDRDKIISFLENKIKDAYDSAEDSGNKKPLTDPNVVSLTKELRKMEKTFENLEKKHGSKTDRFISTLVHDQTFKANFLKITSIFQGENKDTRTKLEEYVDFLRKITTQFVDKPNIGSDDIDPIIEAGLLTIKQSNPSDFNILQSQIHNMNEDELSSTDDDLALKFQLAKLKNIANLVSKDMS